LKSLSDQDHYEILELPSGASTEEIERAYRMALATYSDDSLAGYSVFSDGDNQALRERVEVAFRVLSDRELRRDYDEALGISESPLLPELAAIEAEAPPGLAPSPLSAAPPTQVATASEPLAVSELLELDELHESDGEGDFDGARLRRHRMRCGFELEDIAGVTKISPSYLRFIESEQWTDLPAPVYVRGFVVAYAQCLGLDTKRVARSYMARFEEGREGRRKGRFFDSR
jgi:curved DNA-binding protein CbpA